MMLSEFDLAVDYGQIFVLLPSLAKPVLLWTDEHVAQGFAWSPSAVSFGVPDHDGECLVQVKTAPRVSIEPQALWAVRVPIDVPSASLTIGSVGADHEVNAAAGKYSLVFEALPGHLAEDHDYTFVFKLKFCTDPHPDFEILKQGGELTTNKVLRKDTRYE
jgi:hypothetical protein